jgi:hypothetical protein
MATQSKTTTNHDQIRRWAEARHAQPARVKGTGSRGRDPGMIRLDFPGYSGRGKLEPISWDQWFKSFDDNDLALIYQEKTAGGQRSNFNKLVGRETARARARGNSHASRRKGTSGSSRSSASRSRTGASSSGSSRSSGRSTAPRRKSTSRSSSGTRSGTSARRSTRSRSTASRSRGSSRGSKRSSSRSRS